MSWRVTYSDIKLIRDDSTSSQVSLISAALNLSVCLSVCLSVRLSVCLFTCRPMYVNEGPTEMVAIGNSQNCLTKIIKWCRLNRFKPIFHCDAKLLALGIFCVT